MFDRRHLDSYLYANALIMQNPCGGLKNKPESKMTERAIIIAVDDMFFAAKIRATAEALNVPLLFARKAEEVMKAARQGNPALIILDLHAQRLDPFQLARELKADENLRHVRLLGFFSHVQTELERKARDAGFEQVMPRSAFSKRLAEILQAG
jgi:PleD family two-component response regulator